MVVLDELTLLVAHILRDYAVAAERDPLVPGGNAEIARLKFISDDGYHAQLEELPVNMFRGRGPCF